MTTSNKTKHFCYKERIRLLRQKCRDGALTEREARLLEQFEAAYARLKATREEKT